MTVHAETWIDKSDWGDGPWQHEPDRIEWRDGGLVCLMLRNPQGGMWCGYVGLPPGHPWHGLAYDALDVEVHGGLTFAEGCVIDERPARERICHVPEPGESDDVWWLGFDCHHAWDIAPGHEALMREIRSAVTLPLPPRFEGYGEVYRDVEYVRAEVAALARQCQGAIPRH